MISEIFIERPKLAMVISIVIMIGGILCITKVPVAEYPEITPPQINVSATYPGASAQVIADTVAAPIETEVNGVENMIYFSSRSDNSGNYSLDLTFEPGTDQDIAMVNVQNAVNRAEPVLPEEVVSLGLNVRKRSGDILGVFVFTADEGTMSRLDLSNYVARNIREPVARVPGVAQAYIFGELKNMDNAPIAQSLAIASTRRLVERIDARKLSIDCRKVHINARLNELCGHDSARRSFCQLFVNYIENCRPMKRGHIRAQVKNALTATFSFSCFFNLFEQTASFRFGSHDAEDLTLID